MSVCVCRFNGFAKNNWGKMKKGDLPDVPIEKLDYKYLKTCDDVEELKDIVTLLATE